MSDSNSNRKMTEQELVSYFFDAVNYGHIYNVYQPKMNHVTGRMIGAEALMRMKHPLYGLQMPSDFIPVFEKNDMVFSADLVVCENVCKFLRKCLDEGIPVVPISVNMSRYDVYNHDYVVDHRLGLTVPRVQNTMNGDLDPFIQALRLAEKTEKLRSLHE